MKWLLDTNTLSELTKPAPARELIDWLEANESEAGFSAITIGEMVAGIELLPEGKKRRTLERALKFLREDYAGKIFDFTEGAAVEWRRLVAKAKSAGRNLSVLDSQIEAIAIHFNLTGVTRNNADFFHPVFNPWKP
ncbi:MAG TPA: PIN domain-containing protein [Verrucomicrobiae bacterium]|nr:PIN domain-containing protein [Verrucomicrobiae bacterium]